MINTEFVSIPDDKDSKPIYEVSNDFKDLSAVGAIIRDPEWKRILLVRRLFKETDKNGKLIEKSKRNKIDASGNIILALTSGSGPLKDNPNDPEGAIRKEIKSETGSYPAFLRKFHVYKRVDIQNAGKVGFYIAEMSPGSVDPKSEHKDWPGWFPVEWFGTKIILPYEEQNQVMLDYLREELGKSL